MPPRRSKKELPAFAARLKELREAAGLTQEELAERSGVTRPGLFKIEQGVRVPRWDTVLALAEALGVSVAASAEDPAGRPARGRPAAEEARPALKNKGRGGRK